MRPIRDSLGMLKIIIQTIMLYNPMKAISSLWILFLVGGIFSLIWYLLKDNNTISLIISISCIGFSSLIFVTGLIADLLVNLKNLNERHQ